MGKLLKNPVILLIILIGVGMILFGGGKKIFGFSRFGLWTQTKNVAVHSPEYKQKETMTDVVIDVLRTHSKLSQGLSSYVGSGDLSMVTSTITDVPSYLASVQRLLMTDIVAYLENASDKSAALDTFMAQLQYYQTLGGQYQSALQSVISDQTSQYNTCTSDKDIADKAFYHGLNNGDAIEMQEGLSNSETYGVCQTRARIQVNAHKAMLSRVEYIGGISKNVYTVLSEHHDEIMRNFQLFKDSYLEKLLTIRTQLRSASPGTNN